MKTEHNGSCVCDNYTSYRSTLQEGVPVAMLMQPEDCVNCHSTCGDIFVIGLSNDKKISEEAVNDYFNRQAVFIRTNTNFVAVNMMGDPIPIEDQINGIEARREMVLEAVRSGKAQDLIDSKNF